jgi:hypothetical protein
MMSTNPIISIRGPLRAVLVATTLAAALAACGSEDSGAGAQGSTSNLGPVSPAPPDTSGTVAVTVSGANPVSGNAVVTNSTPGVSIPVSGTVRQVVAEGSGGGLQHRFTVNYDAVSGVVFSVFHAWGASIAAAEATTQCVGTVTAVGQQACGATVTVDRSNNRIAFANTPLRNGSFASILSGQVPFKAP